MTFCTYIRRGPSPDRPSQARRKVDKLKSDLALRIQSSLTLQPFGLQAFEVFLKLRSGLTVRYGLFRSYRIEGLSIGFVRDLLRGRPFGLDHLLFAFRRD